MKIKLYYNNSRKPIQTMETEGGQMLKHQIASMVLLTADTVGDISKLRVLIENEEVEDDDHTTD